MINIGFLQSKDTCDYMVMHDVDLLPRNRDLSYHYDKIVKGPHHIAAPEIHPRYHYKTFIGGILMLKREHYLEVRYACIVQTLCKYCNREVKIL